MKKVRYLDCFAGVWGFALALEQSIGKDNIEHIWYSEWDKFASQVYEEHFPWVKAYWDITKIDIDNLPDIDLLTGWFPCTDVSVAGKWDLTKWRTILVEYLLQILEKKQPKYFVFENVKWLMSKKFFEFRESIFERIKLAWYILDFQILNTKDFWLPQNRERVFMVWQRIKNSDYNRNFIFPKWQELTTFLKDILEEEVDEKYYLSKKAINKITRSKFWQNFKTQETKYTWTLTAWYYKIPADWNYIEFNNKRLTETFKKVETNEPVFLDSYNNKVCKHITPTITTRVSASNSNHLSVNKKVRKLTPTECARLQWFPDNWSTEFVSNSQAYKQMWNAISVPVVKSIFDNLFKSL